MPCIPPPPRLSETFNIKMFKKAIDDIAPYCVAVSFGWCGEPMLHEKLCDMIAFCKRRNLLTHMMTNGTLCNTSTSKALIEAGLDYIVFSFDGATKDVYEGIRVGANFEKTKNNVCHLVKERNKMGLSLPFIDMQMVVVKQNLHEIVAYEAMCRNLGVDGAFLKSLYIDFRSKDTDYAAKCQEKYFLSDEEGSGIPARYDVNPHGVVVPKNIENCPQNSASQPVIDVDGNVHLCCVDIPGELRLGNVSENTFLEIWESYRNVRKQAADRKLPICKDCAMPYETTLRLF